MKRFGSQARQSCYDAVQQLSVEEDRSGQHARRSVVSGEGGMGEGVSEEGVRGLLAVLCPLSSPSATSFSFSLVAALPCRRLSEPLHCVAERLITPS